MLFPWLTWPNAAHLLPSLYWNAAQHEILANSYGQFDAAAGSFRKPLVGIAESGLLAPGGLALQGLIVVGLRRRLRSAPRCAPRGRGRGRRGRGPVRGARARLAPLLRPDVGCRRGRARRGDGRAARAERRRVELIAYIGGRCRRLPERGQRRRVRPRRPERPHLHGEDRLPTGAVFGVRIGGSGGQQPAATADSSTETIRARGTTSTCSMPPASASARSTSGTTTRRIVPRLQLDGLAGAAITGTTGAAVARQLKSRDIDAVFVPSWFWEPGAARHPLADRSPVASWVGVPALRALRVYLPDSNVTYPSVLYAVGSTSSARRRVGSLLESPAFSVEGALSTRRTIVRGGFAVSGPLGGPLHWRIAAPVTESRRTVDPPDDDGRRRGSWCLRLRAEGSPRSSTRQRSSIVPASQRGRGRARSTWPFPGRRSALPLSTSASSRAPGRSRRSFAVFRPPTRSWCAPAATRRARAAASSRPAARQGGSSWSIAGPPARARLRLPRRRPWGRRPSISTTRPVSAWLYDVAGLDRCGSGRWLHAQLSAARTARGGWPTPARRARPCRQRRRSHRPQSAAGLEGSTRQAPRR